MLGGGVDAYGGFGGGHADQAFNGVSFGGGGAGMGGAVFSMFGSLTVINSTLTANTAQGGGPVLLNGLRYGTGGSGFGGAIFNLDGTASITFSTLSGNTVTAGLGSANGSADGGALYNLAYGSNYDSSAAVTASVAISDSILANTVGGVHDLVNQEVDGGYVFDPAANTGNTASIIASAPNVIVALSNLTGGPNGTATVSLPGIIQTDPKLGPLANNGGPTQTMALLAGSPAIDAGNNAAIPTGVTTDQRGVGFARISGAAADLGAFEYQYPITATYTTVISSHNPSSYGQSVTFTAAVLGSSTHKPVTTGSVTFTNGSTILAKNVLLNSSGVAGCTISTLSLTTTPDTIKATYNAAAPHTTSFGTVAQVVNRATPVFSNLSNLTIVYHTSTTTISGKLLAGSLTPPGSVSITVNNITMPATIKTGGTFSANFATKTLAAGTYVVTYAYAGQTNFNAATGAGPLKVTYKLVPGYNPATVYKTGSTIALSFTLEDVNSQDVINIAKSATATGIALKTTPTKILPLPAGSSAGGKFTTNANFDYYTLSLKTTGLAAGTYLLYLMIAGDPVTHSLNFIIGK